MAVILAAVAWLLTYLLHSTVLLGGAFLLAGLGIVRSHAGRDTLWKVTILGGILTATAQPALRLQPAAGHLQIASQPESPFVDVTGVRAIAPPAPAVAAIESQAGREFASAIADVSSPAPAAVPVRSSRPLVSGVHVSWPAMMLNLWMFGALALAARLVVIRRSFAREIRGRRLIADGPLAEMLAELCASAGVRPPLLSVSADLPGPIAFGNEICVPERVLTRLGPSEQRAVLAHELGHVVRRDPAWILTAALIETILFVQPLNRLARRRLRAESEFLCDDWAAERTGGVVLARCLAEVAGWVQGHTAPAAVAGMAGNCSQLVSRVERLLDGTSHTRPTRWIVRAGTAAIALVAVASSMPGVAAEDLGKGAAKLKDALEAKGFSLTNVAGPDEGWGAVRDDGRLIVLSAGYTARFTGTGRIGFRQWGRAIVIPSGYEVQVGGVPITEDRDLCERTGAVRIVEVAGRGAWEITPIRSAGTPWFAENNHPLEEQDLANVVTRTVNRAVNRTVNRTVTSVATSVSSSIATSVAAAVTSRVEAAVDEDDALHGEADAAIDTLMQLWARNPDAVRRAARRLAQNYDRQLRPQFEQLGIELGRELAPQLERVTQRVGRDLTPEFARLGAAIGASILADLAATPEPAVGSGDYRGKRTKN